MVKKVKLVSALVQRAAFLLRAGSSLTYWPLDFCKSLLSLSRLCFFFVKIASGKRWQHISAAACQLTLMHCDMHPGSALHKPRVWVRQLNPDSCKDTKLAGQPRSNERTLLICHVWILTGRSARLRLLVFVELERWEIGESLCMTKRDSVVTLAAVLTQGSRQLTLLPSNCQSSVF